MKNVFQESSPLRLQEALVSCHANAHTFETDTRFPAQKRLNKDANLETLPRSIGPSSCKSSKKFRKMFFPLGGIGLIGCLLACRWSRRCVCVGPPPLRGFVFTKVMPTNALGFAGLAGLSPLCDCSFKTLKTFGSGI